LIAASCSRIPRQQVLDLYESDKLEFCEPLSPALLAQLDETIRGADQLSSAEKRLAVPPKPQP